MGTPIFKRVWSAYSDCGTEQMGGCCGNTIGLAFRVAKKNEANGDEKTELDQ